MKRAVRLLELLLVCAVAAGSTGAVASAEADESSRSPDSSSSALSSLVVPGMQMLDGAQQIQDAEDAGRASPRAFAAREASQTAYEHFDSAQAKSLATEVFPQLVKQPAGGAPQLPANAKIVEYAGINAARVDLPGGKHGVVETTEPMAIEVAPGRRAAIDLRPRSTRRGFEPTRSPVGVQIPKYVKGGIELPGPGVSLQPIDASGSPLAGAAGVDEGASVIYANTLTDADTVVKPTTFGFAADTLLRSVHSPRRLFFRVRMPAGARLVRANGRSGTVNVRNRGTTIATILAPAAQDAEGTSIPVTMGVSGDVLAIMLAPLDQHYRLPIDVDPELNDPATGNSGSYWHSNFHFLHEGSAFSAPEQGTEAENGFVNWTETICGCHGPTEWGGFFYTTQGESHIFFAEFETNFNDTNAHIQNYVVLYAPQHLEAYNQLPVAGENRYFVCSPKGLCNETVTAGAPENNNTAAYQQESTGSGGGIGGSNTVLRGSVTITQERAPELSFNTESPTLNNGSETIPNVLYGSGSWLSPHGGAFEVRARDPGIGLSFYSLDGVGDRREFYNRGECFGVQCPEHVNQAYVYKTGMYEGEASLELDGEDKAGLWSRLVHTVKIDGKPPHAIKINGLQNGDELPLGEANLTIEATDGTSPIVSSGVRSIAVSVDGTELTGPGASCAPGSCTARLERTLAARNYTSGQHSMIVTATDNAGNVAQEEFTFKVHGASPVTIGPGSVDPSTGQLTLSASDVSLGGGTGVSRTYESRDLEAGTEGPLGPQWAINVGGDESLTLQANGNAILDASDGAHTTFTRSAGGGFESPTGDSNLKLEALEPEKGKGVKEYVLKNATGETRTKFEQPEGTEKTTPAFMSQFGAETGELNHPLSETIDPSSSVWVTSFQSDRVEKYSQTGVLQATYGSYGTAAGQFNGPWGIAADPRNGNVYVTDQANSRIEELSPTGAFVKAFGWGVSDGKAEFEICSATCQAGIAGAGAGQVNVEAGLAVDSSGNVWVSDYGNNRIEEFNEKGQYVRAFGSAGVGPEQLEGPLNIAFSGGNLYVTDYRNNRVQEFSPAGAPLGRFGSAGSENGGFSSPYGIASDPRTGNLYVVDSGNTRVQEFTPAGTFLAKFGSSGSSPGQFTTPTGIAVNAAGSIYVVDYGLNRVQMWGRPRWLPTEAGGPLAATTQTYAYKTVEVEGRTVVVPTEALAPAPAGVSCAPTLARGCRALTFEYGEKTTTHGENENELGEFKGHLMRVYFHAWDPAKHKVTETAVAQYLYDRNGRLRAEWDPRISPILKTTYGYDGEGHLTATASPGREPWIFTYGTIAGDTIPDRLLKVTRAPASTSLWDGRMPNPESSPKITGSPVVGVTLGLSSGVWEHAPIAYAYQWEDCNSGGGECRPIPGATNPTYTLTSNDVGHVVEATVAATNGGGSRFTGTVGNHVVTSSGTKVEGEHPGPEPGTTIEYGVPLAGTGLPNMSGAEVARWAQHDDPVEGVAIIPPDEPMGWPATSYRRATIHYWDAVGRMVNTALPSGGIATNEYNETNDVVRTLTADARAASLNEGSGSASASELRDTRSRYSPDGTQLLESRGPQHEVKLAEGGREVLARTHTQYHYNEGAPGGESYDLLTKRETGAEYEGKEADVRTTVTSYSGQNGLGWKLRQPTSVTTDPAGLDLVKTTVYDENTGNVLETVSPTSSATNPIPSFSFSFGSAGGGQGQFEAPAAVAVNQKTGNVYVAAYTTGRVEEFSSGGKFVAWIGTPGTGPGQMSKPEAVAIDPSGNIFVGDSGNERVDEFNEKGEAVREFGTKGTGEGQFGGAIGGVAIEAHHIWVSDTSNDRVEEFATTNGKYLHSFGTLGSGNGQFAGPTGIVVSGGHLYVDDTPNHRIQEFTTSNAYVSQFGSFGTGNGQFEAPVGIAGDPKSGDLFVSDYGSDRVEEFTSTGAFVAWLGSYGSGKGQFNNPKGLATSAGGELYVVDSGNTRVDSWAPGYAGSHTAQTIYYSVKANSKAASCGKHPEWADLPCETQAAAQPETPGLPSLPVTLVTYNIWGEPENTTETFGTTTRTKSQTFDAAGRALTSEVSSSADSPLPQVTNEYNEKTGALEKRTTTQEGKTQVITSIYNRLDQLEKYTDADGVTTTYTYDVDGRVQEVNLGKVDGESASQIYSYDPATGSLTKLFDTAAGTFTASYDAEGKLASESYPNGMSATYTRNPAGEATGVEYVKTTHCTKNCTWFSDVIVPSIHGQTLKQASTLSEQSYAYDAGGRLTQAQETAGKNCTTRAYSYDEDGNRIGSTTHEPGVKGECTVEGGVSEAHIYDSADRLNDSGVGYDAFGNTTSLPAADAGGQALKSTYYDDNQVASQEQAGKTVAYSYDPAGRTRERHASGQEVATLHYAGTGEALSWTTEGASLWTRNIPGIDGSLAAVQTNGEAPVLQLQDLQGNIVATAAISETKTKLLSTYNSTEFGVPSSGGSAPKYAWLGASGVNTELPASGVVTTGASSYVPEIGRALQTERVVPPGDFPNGASVAGVVQATYVEALNGQLKAIAVEHEAALEAAARKQAEEAFIVGEDPIVTERFLALEEINLVLGELRNAYQGSNEEIEEHVAVVGKFYFGFIQYEGYLNKNIKHFVAEQYGFALIAWGNYVFQTLQECREGLYENRATGRGTCGVDTLLANTVEISGIAIVNNYAPDWWALPAISICLKGQGQCTRVY